MKHVMGILALAALLSACGEKPQERVPVTKDASAFSGTGMGFVDGGWKPGDKASWESHLKARGHYGMNDYSRMN